MLVWNRMSSGHGVTSGGPGEATDFTMSQTRFSETQPNQVAEHTDPEVCASTQPGTHLA